MRFASACSGIEAATVAWKPLGWRAAWFSEIEKFPCAVLGHRHPEVPNLGNLLEITEDQIEACGHIDVLVGGTPCQSFSVAGLRGGLDDARGNLALRFMQIAGIKRPDWVVWENVPGVLSSGGGRDFGAIVGALAKLGYGWAYRVLDAQYFGVPQRRRRVFLVGYLGDWRRAAAVLLESQSLRGNSPPRRQARESIAREIAPSVRACGLGFARTGDSRGQDCVVAAVTSKWAKGSGGPSGDECQNLVTHALRGEGHDGSEDGTGRGTPLVPVAATLSASSNPNSNAAGRRREDDTNLVFQKNQRDEVRTMEIAGALASEPGMKQQNYLLQQMQVRRLTPRECERLQGFPDDYTAIAYKGKPAADGPRYKAIGNSMAVPVMHWLGKRIQEVANAPAP